MTKKLEGKTAVITGGTEGIGLATGRLVTVQVLRAVAEAEKVRQRYGGGCVLRQ